MIENGIGTTISETITRGYEKWHDRPFTYVMDTGAFSPETYGSVIERAFALAHKLRQTCKAESRVAIFMANSTQWIIADYAVSLSGNIAVLMDASWQLLEAKNASLFVEPDVMFYDDSTSDVVKQLRHLLQKTIFISAASFTEKSVTPPPTPGRTPAAPSKIFFSSGTTGTPKAIVLSEENMLFGWKELRRRMHGVDENDRVYVFLPFHHVYANVTILLYVLPLGCSLFIASSSTAIAHEMPLAKPTIIHTVPLFFERIVQAIDQQTLKKAKYAASLASTLHLPVVLRKRLFKKLHAALGGNVKYLLCGGARLNAELHKFFMDAGFSLYTAYGLTETSGGVSGLLDGSKKYGSAGKAFKDVDLTIDKPDTDGVGEICVKGLSVFHGYLNNEIASKNAFDEKGYFRTGDLGYLDSDKDLYVVGRKKRTILLSNGENVWPEEIEKLFCSQKGVLDARVFESAEKIHAMIWYKPGERESIEHSCEALNSSLSKHARIHHFDFVPGSSEIRSIKR